VLPDTHFKRSPRPVPTQACPTQRLLQPNQPGLIHAQKTRLKVFESIIYYKESPTRCPVLAPPAVLRSPRMIPGCALSTRMRPQRYPMSLKLFGNILLRPAIALSFSLITFGLENEHLHNVLHYTLGRSKMLITNVFIHFSFCKWWMMLSVRSLVKSRNEIWQLSRLPTQ
jgi:hypothetical protein